MQPPVRRPEDATATIANTRGRGPFHPFYLHPATARALLAESRRRTATARVQRDLRAALHAAGWDGPSAAELAEVHVERRGLAGALCGVPA